MPTASIHDLAVEVLEQIFAYACTDGGQTGYSLSLVSKYCYVVVRPLLLHNVALLSLKQIESFNAYLSREQRLSPHSRVYHLFVSTIRDGEQVARTRRLHSSRAVPRALHNPGTTSTRGSPSPSHSSSGPSPRASSRSRSSTHGNLLQSSSRGTSPA